MIFKTMKTEDILEALEGHENILDPAVKENERFFNTLSCVDCGGDVYPIVNPKKLFNEGALLPNFWAKCKLCGVEFEPHTKIQLTLR